MEGSMLLHVFVCPLREKPTDNEETKFPFIFILTSATSECYTRCMDGESLLAINFWKIVGA
jgi:hypothetical protein